MVPVGKLIDCFLPLLLSPLSAPVTIGPSTDTNAMFATSSMAKKVYPVNPRAQTVLGDAAYADLASLPEAVESVSVITPPAVTEKVVDQAIAAGVKNIWLQPGAETQAAVDKARAAGLNVIAGGPCLLVSLGYHE